MAEENTQVQEQEKQEELTLQERLAQVNTQLSSLRQTEAACAEILKNKNIRIVDLADESEEPLSLTLTGNAVTTVIRPIVQGISSNKEQLITIKEQLLTVMEQEVSGTAQPAK